MNQLRFCFDSGYLSSLWLTFLGLDQRVKLILVCIIRLFLHRKLLWLFFFFSSLWKIEAPQTILIVRVDNTFWFKMYHESEKFFELLKMSWQRNVLGFTIAKLFSTLDWQSGAKHHCTLLPPTGCGGRNKSIKQKHSFLIYCHINALGDSCSVECCAGWQNFETQFLTAPGINELTENGAQESQWCPAGAIGALPTSSTVRRGKEGPDQKVFSTRSQQAEVFFPLSWVLVFKEHNYWNIYLDKWNRLSAHWTSPEPFRKISQIWTSLPLNSQVYCKNLMK